MAFSFGRFQLCFFCCVGRSVIDVLSDFQLDSLTFVEVMLYCVHLSLCVVSIFLKKKISSTLQQRVCIKICVKNGFTGAQTLEMLEKCFGNDALTRSNVFRRHERFRSGRELVEDDERSGRPSMAKTDENINKMKGWMTVSRKLTITKIAEELNITYGSAQDILVNDLGLRRVATKLVPKDLNFMQKRDCVDLAKDMLFKVDSDPSFIKRIIIGDETWIYEYDTHSRHQASE